MSPNWKIKDVWHDLQQEKKCASYQEIPTALFEKLVIFSAVDHKHQKFLYCLSHTISFGWNIIKDPSKIFEHNRWSRNLCKFCMFKFVWCICAKKNFTPRCETGLNPPLFSHSSLIRPTSILHIYSQGPNKKILGFKQMN